MRSLLLALVLLLPLPACAQGGPAAEETGMVADPCAGPPTPAEEMVRRDWAKQCRYAADNRRLLAMPDAARRVVFLGDSITEGWNGADPGFFADGVVNRGISGQTSEQLLVRFSGDVLALRPRAVHLMIGTNDLAGNTGRTSAARYQATIAAMVTLAKAQGIRVILAAIPPAAGFPWRPGVQPAEQIVALNRWLAGYAAANGLVFVDYHRAMADGAGAMRAGFSTDGVHPSAAGYAAMAPLARAAMAAALAR
jgi:lysophospholipase L1-like esterase